MVPCLKNLYPLSKLIERHIEGLEGIFYFYFAYFCIFELQCKPSNYYKFFIYILSPFTIYQLCFHGYNFSNFKIK
jgi:hypothetical protein